MFFFGRFRQFRRDFFVNQGVLDFPGDFPSHFTGVGQSGGVAGDFGAPAFPGIAGGGGIAGGLAAAVRFDSGGRPLDVVNSKSHPIFRHFFGNQVRVVGSKARVFPGIVYPIRITLSAAFFGDNSGSIQR